MEPVVGTEVRVPRTFVSGPGEESPRPGLNVCDDGRPRGRAVATAVGDALFFRVCEATNGSELWTSDGIRGAREPPPL